MGKGHVLTIHGEEYMLVWNGSINHPSHGLLVPESAYVARGSDPRWVGLYEHTRFKSKHLMHEPPRPGPMGPVGPRRPVGFAYTFNGWRAR